MVLVINLKWILTSGLYDFLQHLSTAWVLGYSEQLSLRRLGVSPGEYSERR